MTHSTRRDFVVSTLAAGAAIASPSLAHSASDRRSIYKDGSVMITLGTKGDIEVVINGGMNETSTTSPDSPLIRAERAVYREYGLRRCYGRAQAVRTRAQCSRANR